jgi:hypothetical protein
LVLLLEEEVVERSLRRETGQTSNSSNYLKITQLAGPIAGRKL